MKRIKGYVVNVKMPENVSITDMECYIREAVQTWKGQMNPDSEIFNMKNTDFGITAIRGEGKDK